MLHKATMSRKHYITICTAKTAQFLFNVKTVKPVGKACKIQKTNFIETYRLAKWFFLFSNLSLSFLSVADNYKEEKEKPAFCSSLPLGFLCYDIFSKFSRIK
jgi:hypothetical protein